MLSQLHIQNLAIIQEQTISFGPGLNVISGETGAGKSIILEAIRLILGGRGSSELVRSGAESLTVDALFDLSAVPDKILNELPEIVGAAEQQELLLSRQLSTSGRSKVYINGRLGSVSLLEEISSKLINLCGQNQFLKLFDPSYHREVVDDFARNQSLVENYQEFYGAWAKADRLLRETTERLEANVLKRAELEIIVEELRTVSLRAGIRAELEAKVKALGSSEHLLQGTTRIIESLNAEEGVLALCNEVKGELLTLSRLDPSLAKLVGTLDGAKDCLLDFDREISRYQSAIDQDEESLNKLREELAEIARLERKYRTNDQGLLNLLEQADRELALFNAPESLGALRKEAEELRIKTEEVAAKLHKAREVAGEKLAKSVREELAELNMKDAKLKLSLTKGELREWGGDDLELLISTNPGEPFHSLKQIASGGELARIMLVLKKVLRERSGVNVLIFDEVDSGISGGVARAVGEKLRSLAHNSQVICITHLAQVASLADRHILVEKESGKRAITVVRNLTENERIEEVARMLAGYKVTDASRESARELIASKSSAH